jgi:hypothetical protein
MRHSYAQGLLEGHELGWQKGAEIGKKLGFYRGCAITWAKLIQDNHELYSSRCVFFFPSFFILLKFIIRACSQLVFPG